MKSSLNSIYRTIWSEALGAWIAVSEITKTKGKRSSSSLIRSIRPVGAELDSANAIGGRLKPIVFAVACCFAINAQANPLGGQVINGQATFNNNGNTLTVTNTPGAIINWQGFSINSNEVTHFAQQSAASSVLNRVITNNPSAILGTLSSNGRVFLVNPSGIFFGAGSTVDVAGLVATSLNLNDADFLAGRHNYTAVAGAQNVSNAGSINTQQNGQVYLIAPNVENTGIINAANGEILLVAGHSVELVNALDPNLRVNIIAPAGDATNIGQLISSAGTLGLFGTVVRNSGLASADSATMQGGKIIFRSSQRTEISGTASAQGVGGGEIKVLSDMHTGTVQVSGTLDASATTVGDGGFIDTSAAHLDIRPTAHIAANATNGKAGEWLIDPLNVTINALTAPATFGGSFVGGVWTPTISGSYISNGTIQAALNLGTNVTVTTVNGGFAEAGDINVNASITKTGGAAATLTLNAENNINFALGTGVSSTVGSLNVVLRSDADANGAGTVTFAGTNAFSLAGGRADLYYNPTSYTDAATKSDSLTNPYSGVFTATPYTAWMLVNDVGLATGGTLGLQAMSTNMTGRYALGKNIVATATATWNPDGLGGFFGFAPVGTIGSPATNFSGMFDGQGRTIDGLYINRSGDGGLFGFTNASTIKDVTLANVNITGGGYVGALIGWHQGSLANSHVVSGTVTGTGTFSSGAGGLIGMNYNGSNVSNSSAGATVFGASYVGGLIGASQQSTLTNVSATGNVTGTNWGAGGLVGSMEGDISPHSLTNGTASGNVSGSRYVGGLVGWNGYWSTINNGIASGNVTSTLTDAGGLVGMNAYNIISSHATGSVTGVTNVGGLVGNNQWDNNPSMFYTYGTISSSYATIGTVTGSTNVGGLVGSSSSTAFNSIDTDYATTNVFGSTNVGGLVGYFTGNTTVANSYATGNVSGNGATNANLGGLVGQMNGGTVNTSYSTATTVAGGGTSSSNVGGLVGWNRGTILNSYATVTSVSGGNMVGGLVGNSEWEINGSYVSTGSVTGVSNYGGLVGALTLSGFLTNSHYNINGVTINAANFVTPGGLYNDNTASFNIVGQYTDWLVNGSKSLNIANYTSPYGSFGNLGINSYTIGNTQGLKDMLGFADNPYTFTLTAAIDLTGLAGFYVPILASSFNGAGFTVSNLNLNQSTSSLGMFGEVTGTSTVSNLVLVDASVNANGGTYVGALAGMNLGTITNCSVTTSVGGITSVSGGAYVGGLVGFDGGSSTVNLSSFSAGINGTASVTGTTNIGGLVGGHASVSVIDISDSGVYANTGGSVNVSGVSNVGGLVGYLDGHVGFSYVSNATITASGSNIGGIAGLNVSLFPTDTYFNVDVVTTNGGNNVTRGGLYAGQYNTWFSAGRHTPLNIANYSSTLVLQGDGSYGINSLQGMKDMLAFSGYSLNNFSLTGSIDLATLPGYCVPYLAGSFNGNNFNLSNLSINLPNVDMGLFGNINFTSSVVSNLNLVDFHVNGSANVGALAGTNFGTIDNVTVSGANTIVGSAISSNLGGLVGYNNRGTINNSHVVNAAVSGASYVGGLVGYNYGTTTANGIISNSDVTNGSVTGSGFNIGGLAGYNWNGSIVASHATNPTVNGGAAASVGGLVGYNQGTTSTPSSAATYTGTISNSYVIGGAVTSTGTDIGGLVGTNRGGLVDRSRVDTVSVNGGLNVGGLVGNDSGEGSAMVSNSFAFNTNVTGTTGVGGLIGNVLVSGPSSASGNANFDTVLNSYVSGGTVSGATNVGGLVGQNFSRIANSYADVGSATGNAATTGALIGTSSGMITNSYWNSAIATGIGTNTGTASGSGLSVSQMTSASSFVGWNIASTGGAGMIWRIYEGQTGPLLTSFLKPLVITADAASKTYDGLVFSGGLVNPTYTDGVNPVVPNLPDILGTANAYGTSAINAGTYAPALYSGQLGYDISYVGGLLTIGTSSLSVISLNGTRVYDGTANVDWSAFTLAGLIGGQTLTLSGVGTVADANVGINKPVALGTLALGNGTNGGLASNYTFTGGNHTATITPATLTYTANATSRTYGANNPAFSGTVSGFMMGETLASATIGTPVFTTLTPIASNVGSYALIGEGLVANNGNYTFVQAASNASALTVTPAMLTYMANAASRIFGDADPAFSGSVTGFVLTDNLANATTGSATFSTLAPLSSNVGSYAINGSGLNANNGNYTFVQAAGNTSAFSITQRIISVIADMSSKVYGDADPNLFTVGGAGLASWDTNATAFTGSLSHTGGENVGTYTITQGSLLANTNYNLSGFTGNNLLITPAPLTVAADSKNKVLGTPDPLLTYMTYGLKFNDSAATTLSGALDRDVGDTIGTYSINQGSLTLLSSNYTMTYVAGTFRILAPTVVQEITQTTVGSAPAEEEKKETGANDLLADATTDDSGQSVAASLPVCQ